jgi:hypothetical protein
MSLELLDQRVTALERAVSDLQRQLLTQPAENWLEQLTGSFKDEPAFDEVVEYGRQFRWADRPNDGDEVQR